MLDFILLMFLNYLYRTILFQKFDFKNVSLERHILIFILGFN